VYAVFSGATVRRINFRAFDNDNLWDIADEARVHPTFR
jgi:hypothetical protein